MVASTAVETPPALPDAQPDAFSTESGITPTGKELLVKNR
jgi:hypothetical protein